MAETPPPAVRVSWSELPPENARYFAHRITAESEEVFGPTAQEAGIFTLSALRFTLRSGIEHHPAIEWTDPYTPSTSCIMIGNTYRSPISPMGFAVVTELPDRYEITGVSINNGEEYNDGHALGSMMLPRAYVQGSGSRIGASVHFFDAARAQAKAFGDRLRSGQAGDGLSEALVDGATIGRLSASLRSLAGNLATTGIQSVEGEYANQTYKLADYLLRRVLGDIAAGLVTNAEPSYDSAHRMTGAAFDGPTLIRRLPGVPVPTIALTTAVTDMAEQYFIQPRGTFRNFQPLTDGLTRETFLDVLPILDRGLAEDAASRTFLDSNTLRALEQKILNIVQGRINAPKPAS